MKSTYVRAIVGVEGIVAVENDCVETRNLNMRDVQGFELMLGLYGS